MSDTQDTTQPDATRLVPLADAARLADVSPRTLQRAMQRGELTRHVAGGRVSCRVGDVMSWRDARDSATRRDTPRQRQTTRQPEPPVVSQDARDVRLAAIEAELAATHHQLAFVTEQLELRRLEGERKDQTIAEQAAALGEAMTTIRAMQAAAVPPMLVDAVPTGMPLERPLEPPERTDPPSVTHKTLKPRGWRPPLWPERWP